MSGRKKIFGDWPNPPQRLYVDNNRIEKKKKDNQSLRAQQYLDRSLFLLTNINSTKEIKQSYKNEQQLCTLRLQQIYQKLESVTNQQFDFKNAIKDQKQLYKQIRKSRVLLNDIKAFTLTNLSNFDNNTSRMLFTRNKEQAQTDLNNFIKDLTQKRLKLQQSLVHYEYSMQQSKILGDTQKFDYCLNQLSDALNQQNMIMIHSLMMYQIRSIKQIQQNQQKIVNESESIYNHNQAIFDSMSLMQNHSIKMQKDEKYFQDCFKKISVESSKVISDGYQNLGILEKNLQIYESNKQNFIRIEAQTNIKKYQQYRKLYTNRLNSYIKSFKIWKDKMNIAHFLYQKQIQITIFKQKSAISTSLNNLDKEHFMHTYYSTLEKEVPITMPEIKKYKYNICSQMEKQINKTGLSTGFRASINSSNQDILTKYTQFFTALQFKTNPQKSQYLYRNKQLINIFLYQIKQDQQKKLQSDYQIQKYSIGFQYALKIAELQEDLEHKKFLEAIDIAKYLKQFDKIRTKRWKSLPIGLDNVLFNYVNNLRIYQHLQSYMQENRNNAKSFQVQFNDYLKNREKNIEGNETEIYILFNFDSQNYQKVYQKVIHQISDYNHSFSVQIQKQYWQEWSLIILNAYQGYFKEFQFDANNFRKRNFFTFKLLSYLVTGKPLKLPNIDQTWVNLMKYIDQGYYLWDCKKKFLQIIKISIFNVYFEKNQSNIRVKVYMELCQNLIQFMRLLLQCQIFLQKYRNTHQYFSYGLNIQNRLSLFFGVFTTTEKIELQEKFKHFVKKLKKLPIVVGTETKIKQFSNIFSVQSLLNDYRLFKSLKSQMSGIQQLSYIYRTNKNLITVEKMITSNYKNFENISIKNRNESTLYLKQISQKLEKQVVPLNPLLILVDRVFKDQYDKLQMSEIKIINEDQQSIEETLKWLIKM